MRQLGTESTSRDGSNPRVTFDGKVRNLDHVLKFDSPLPEDHHVSQQPLPPLQTRRGARAKG